MIDARKLTTEGKVYVPYPSSLRLAMANAMDAWVAFCALPDAMKLLFPYEADTTVSGNGYELKTAEGDRLDRKEDFHIRLSAHEPLLAHARSIGNPEVEVFVRTALELPEQIQPLLAEFARSVEATYGLEGFEDDIVDAIPNLIVRFLHYFGDRKPGEEIGSPHIDKGGLTLHLYESEGGVEQLTMDRKWIPLPVSHEETVIFPSIGMQHKLHNKVKALCHRIVATPESAVHGRYSAVCFVDFRNNARYDKKRHGRLQGWDPGFNYNMPWEKFDDLFVK